MDIEKSTGSTHGPDDDADGEINLAVYLLAIWRGRYVIVVVTALCAVTALVVTRLMPRTYEAASRLVVVTPKSSVGTTIAQALSEMGRDRAPNVATFRELAGSRSLAARVVTEFQLSSAPDFLTPPGFLANCVTIETPKDTEVIEVRVRLRQPDLAARVANRMADGAVELAARMNEQEAATMTDVIQTQLGESRSRFERANANLQALRATPQGGTPRAAANRTATNGGPRCIPCIRWRMWS